MRPPWKFDGERPDRPGTAPRVGAHSRAVAAEVYSPEQIEELVQNKVIYAEE